jgi:hypothetical protein
MDRERKPARGVASGVLSPSRVGNRRRTMHQRLHWLDYDPVAVGVLVIGMGIIGLLASLV